MYRYGDSVARLGTVMAPRRRRRVTPAVVTLLLRPFFPSHLWRSRVNDRPSRRKRATLAQIHAAQLSILAKISYRTSENFFPCGAYPEKKLKNN